MNAVSTVVPALNLLDTPWLPVRMLDGQVMEVGLLELFERASQIEGLAETSPPNLVALYRLLLAITHRALTRSLGTWTDRDRARWYREGLPAEALIDYLHHWRERFWVFHPEHPFMQVAALAEDKETRDKLKPWTKIALGRAAGDSPVVFDHNVDTDPTQISANEAIRNLLGYLQFVPGGLIKVLRTSDNGGPLANCAAVLPVGTNLCQTIALALHPPAKTDADTPTWERTPPTIAALCEPATLAAGYVDCYTRQTRAVLVRFDADTPLLVRCVCLAAGMALRDDANAPDPMTPLRLSSTGPIPLRLSEGRALWRDLATLMPNPTNDSVPAGVLGWAANLLEAAGIFDADVPVMVAGVAQDPRKAAKSVRWRNERYRLPASALLDIEVAQEIRSRLREANDLYEVVERIAADMLAKAMPDPLSKDTRSRARALLDSGPFATAYFSNAERNLPSLLQSVARSELDAAHAQWSAALLRASQAAWDAARSMLGQSASALRAEASCYGKYQSAIKDVRMAAASAQNSASTTAPQEASA